jgi:hypothetical protein
MTFERWYPLGGGLVAGLSVFLFRESLYLPETLKELFPVVISISAIAVGFLATAKSILLSIEDRPVIRHLKELGGYDDLVRYLLTAVNWSLIASLVSSIFLLFLHEKDTWWYRDGFAGWAFVTVAAMLMCYRVLRLFAKILMTGSKSPDTTVT